MRRLNEVKVVCNIWPMSRWCHILFVIVRHLLRWGLKRLAGGSYFLLCCTQTLRWCIRIVYKIVHNKHQKKKKRRIGLLFFLLLSTIGLSDGFLICCRTSHRLQGFVYSPLLLYIFKNKHSKTYRASRLCLLRIVSLIIVDDPIFVQFAKAPAAMLFTYGMKYNV